MESEKKIYIKGNKQYSNLINAYFKKLGIKNLTDDYYAATNYIYYITHDDLVGCCNEEYEMAYIIKDNYKEITIDELIKLFEANKEKVKVTLHPFDKVLVKCDDTDKWEVDLFSSYNEDRDKAFCCVGILAEECIPYNKDTAHLLGTNDDCSINYEIECTNEFKE
jgi:hypothetical protein